MRMLVGTVVVVLVIATACGGEEKAAPAAWCEETGLLMYLVDQHSTTLDAERLGDWEESTPDEIRASAERAATALRRYPVDADDSELVSARAEIERYAKDRCRGGWRAAPLQSSG
jgi:arsenate reductase-like glutaredoxin family protein